MANVVKLYSASYVSDGQWELIPSKLLVVDDIASYLATKTAVTISDFQYVKNELEIGINVDLSQEDSQPATITTPKYASIQNNGERIHYYFVKKCIWRSKHAVRLELVLDVLNTFKEGSDYNFKANTKINREHKNRFLIKKDERYITITFDDYNEITEDNPQVDSICTIMDGDDTILSGIKLVNYITESDVIKGMKFLIPNSDTRTDNEILARFRGYPQDTAFQIWDSADNELEIAFDDIPFSEPHEPVITRDGRVYRDIDKTPENIMPILVCDNLAAEKVEHTINQLRGDWYLLYRNQNNPSESLVNPVECYLIPEKSGLQVDSGYIANGLLIPSFLTDGTYYFFNIVTDQTYTLSNGVVINKYAGPNAIMITRSGDRMNVTALAVINGDLMIMKSYDDIYSISISPLPAEYYTTTSINNLDADFINNMTFPNTFDNTDTYKTLHDITKVDRTDAKNIKLIKLPYCPYDFDVVGGIIKTSLTPDWDVVSLSQSGGPTIICLKLHDLNTNLSGKFDDEDYNPFSYLYFGKLSNIDTSLTHLREQANYESKLYHSEFFTPTFYYDSFAFKFELEKVDKFWLFSNYTKTSAKNEIKFDVTRTINSKFMFTFDNYEVFDNEQNYAKYLPIARNNEEVLYNVPYINYIRTGYQYDVKNKNISNISNAIGVGLSAGSLAVSLALPSAPLKVAGVVASLVSMAMSVKTAVVSAIDNENSLKQKISQYQNQSSSVAGSDDVDLMSIYAENRLKYLVYEPRREMEGLIFDLFFYAGYRSDRMAIPTHHNRVNFDYLECDASLENVASIPNDCLDELINCFKNGVTYLHKTNREDKWDFSQKYENWEMDFFS